MLKIINNKIYIVRGDDEVLEPGLMLSDEAQTAYTLGEDEQLTLTVRALPSADSSVLLSVSSNPGSARLVLRSEDTAGME